MPFQYFDCDVDLKKHDPEDLDTILSDLPKLSIVVHEDISASTFQGLKCESKQEGFPVYDLLRLFASPTFLEGFITIMTTNYLQEIQEFSPELIREGRVGKMIEFKQITEKEAAKMFRRITSPNDENLSPELGAKFRKLFRVKKITHSAVKHYLLKRKNDSRSAYNNAERWLEDRLAEEFKGDGIQRTTRVNEVGSD
ncbi:hypothetical protein QC760_010569 [Botrytis cinerea]